MKAGEKYYIIQHPYYHYLVEVKEVLGKSHIVCGRCVRVHRCQRDFTKFFREGCKSDTEYTVFPEGREISGWMSADPWNHEIPQ